MDLSKGLNILLYGLVQDHYRLSHLALDTGDIEVKIVSSPHLNSYSVPSWYSGNRA